MAHSHLQPFGEEVKTRIFGLNAEYNSMAAEDKNITAEMTMNMTQVIANATAESTSNIDTMFRGYYEFFTNNFIKTLKTPTADKTPQQILEWKELVSNDIKSSCITILRVMEIEKEDTTQTIQAEFIRNNIPVRTFKFVLTQPLLPDPVYDWEPDVAELIKNNKVQESVSLITQLANGEIREVLQDVTDQLQLAHLAAQVNIKGSKLPVDIVNTRLQTVDDIQHKYLNMLEIEKEQFSKKFPKEDGLPSDATIFAQTVTNESQNVAQRIIDIGTKYFEEIATLTNDLWLTSSNVVA